MPATALQHRLEVLGREGARSVDLLTAIVGKTGR